MTKEEFKMIAAGLRATYRRDKLLDDPESFRIWYELLKDLSYEMASAAAQAYMMTEHFPPAPADIRKKALELVTAGTEISEGEAWYMVRRAIANGIYGSELEFRQLPEDIQKAVGTHKQLKIWAMDENFNESVIQSQFLRSYRQIRERRKRTDLLPASMQDRIAQLTARTVARLEGE